MAEFLNAETRKLAVTASNQIVDFGTPHINKLYVIADATTVRIDFDQPTDDSSFPLLEANVPFGFDVRFNKLHVSTSSGTANLYMIGVRY